MSVPCNRPCVLNEGGICYHAYCINPWIPYPQTATNATPKPQTNADRIRAMTDEEIEEWYWWMHKEMMRYTNSRVFVHEWLKQECET